MTTSEIATLPGYEEFAPWLLVEKRGNAPLGDARCADLGSQGVIRG